MPVAAHRSTAERLRGQGIAVERQLGDGQLVDLDEDGEFPVRVFHTPGHARGHLCFLEESHGSMLVGDLVAGFGTIVIDPPEGNMADYLSSLARIRDLAPRAIFPSHGPMTVEPVAKLDEYVQHRLWREERILQAWNEGVRETRGLLDRVYDDVAPLAHPLAERQILAHLEHLRSRDRLRP